MGLLSDTHQTVKCHKMAEIRLLNYSGHIFSSHGNFYEKQGIKAFLFVTLVI